VIIYKFMLQCT